MNRAYGTLYEGRHSSQRIEIRCYKMNRADGSNTTSIYSHYLITDLAISIDIFTGCIYSILPTFVAITVGIGYTLFLKFQLFFQIYFFGICFSGYRVLTIPFNG
jgi:hypothetical protein